MKHIKLFEAFNGSNGKQDKPWTWNGDGGYLCIVDGDGRKGVYKLENGETYRDALNRIENHYRDNYGVGKDRSMPAGGFEEDRNMWIDKNGQKLVIKNGVLTTENFKLNEVAGSLRFTHIQNIGSGELHRFANVGSRMETNTFPVGTYAQMKDLPEEVLDKVKNFTNDPYNTGEIQVIKNIIFTNPNDKSKFCIFYTKFDENGKEILIYPEYIVNNTGSIKNAQDIIDGWNRHS